MVDHWVNKLAVLKDSPLVAQRVDAKVVQWVEMTADLKVVWKAVESVELLAD